MIPFQLQRYFFPRILPILLIFVILLSASAPLSYYVLKMRELQSKAGIYAEKVADFLQKEVYSNPILWKYETLKLIKHIRSLSYQPSLSNILIQDINGNVVNQAKDKKGVKARSAMNIWQMAPIIINNQVYGRVYVGFDTRRVRVMTLFLILPFWVIGMLLSGSIYLYFRRLILASQQRIEGLFREVKAAKAEVEKVNQSLEKSVETKTLELSQALDKVQKSQQKLHQLARKSIFLLEDEKRSIARELHDSLGQMMTAIRIDLELLKQGKVTPKQKDIIHRATAIVDTSLDELRTVVDSIRPPILDYEGLGGAVSKLVEQYQERTTLCFQTQISLDPQLVPGAVELACYRVIQEAVNNSVKHAGATQIMIDLQARNDCLTLQIRDNGQGFDSEEVQAKESKGISGMKERVAILGGEISFNTGPGKGCEIQASFPLVVQENERENGKKSKDN